jgi:hypothetical protein
MNHGLFYLIDTKAKFRQLAKCYVMGLCGMVAEVTPNWKVPLQANCFR